MTSEEKYLERIRLLENHIVALNELLEGMFKALDTDMPKVTALPHVIEWRAKMKEMNNYLGARRYK